MLLANGITGFSNGKPIFPKVDQDEFKSVCYRISNTLQFRIEEFDFNLIGKNFYIAKIKFEGEILNILVNAQYPVMGFATEINAFNIQYADNERLKTEFEYYYSVLSFSELEKPIDNDDYILLNDVEREQIAYYKPETLGEIIFNYWD
jgi:hypothetical protein